MRKSLLLTLTLLLTLSVTACGNSSQAKNNTANDTASEAISEDDSQSEQQEDERVRFFDLGEKEKEFVADYGHLMLTWLTRRTESTKWLSLEGVWEDNEGNLYIYLSYKDDSVLIKIKDITEEGYNACDAYFDLPDDANAVPLDTKAITKYLSGIR